MNTFAEPSAEQGSAAPASAPAPAGVGGSFNWSWSKLLAWSAVSLLYPIAIIVLAVLSKWMLVCCYRVQQVPMFSCFIWRSDLAYEIELVMRSTAKIFDGTRK